MIKLLLVLALIFGMNGLVLALFAGEKARNANHATLATARQMEARADSRDEIWRATGWFRGPEGKWKFEIDDGGLRISIRPGR